MKRDSYIGSQLRAGRRHLWPVIVLDAIMAGLYSAMNLFTMNIVNAALAGSLEDIGQLALRMVLVGLTLIPLRLLYSRSSTNFVRKTLERVKIGYLQKLFRKNINEFREDNNGVYLSQLTNDLNTLETYYLEPQLTVINSAVNVVAVFVVLGIVDPVIILVAAVTMAVLAWTARANGKPMEKPQKEKSLLLERYTSYIREVLSAFAIIKNNSLDERITSSFAETSKAVQDKNYELDKEYTLATMRIELSIGVINLALLAFMIWTVRSRGFGAGGAILLINTFSRLGEPVMRLSEQLPMLKSTGPLLEKIDKQLENQTEDHETLEINDVRQGIRLEGLSFAYGENQVLQGVDLDLEAGSKYLIVGPSGGGKSTLLKLLRKFVPPDSGTIRLDGQDLADITKESYFRLLANVEQQVFLFDDNVRNNITLFKEYPEAEVERAVRGAGLESVVAEFSDGLDHQIRGNGSNISGGQKARIAIARALISKARILILDEAFASLDEEVARQIEQTVLALDNVLVLQVSHVLFRDTMHQYDGVLRVADRGITQIED